MKSIRQLFAISLFSVFALLLLNACDMQNKRATIEMSVVPAYPDTLPKGRLPATVAPLHYSLELTVIPAEKNFHGTVRINIINQTPTQHLWLHGNRLTVNTVTVQPATGDAFSAQYQQVDSTGISKLTLDKPLAPGKATLVLNYSAAFDESLEGIYRVKDGEEYYAFTQFEATSARLAFPGFDEPAFKVPFDITLIVKAEHSAVSNTPEAETTVLGNGLKRIRYITTKPLPTYLVAFAVGAFDVVNWSAIPASSVRPYPVPLRGIATRGKGDKFTYALKHTPEIVTALENYFQAPYPYPKLDLIAVPDFQAGAMENAGAITYREQRILLDKDSSLQLQRRHFVINAHEIAHQWFGNLVTPVWWDDIWLNEAFATWMSYTVLDGIKPEHKFRQSLLENSLGAMQLDGLVNARKIRQPIASNHDIDSAFDGITYKKGGAVLSMLESYLTPEVFQSGIQAYMQKFAFRNATTNDFITAIAEKADADKRPIIRDAFNSFIEQPGIPYLNIQTQCSEHAKITVTQSRFLPLGSKGEGEKSWIIPACFRYQIGDTQHQYCSLIEHPSQSIILPEAGCPKYVLPNSQGAGYYRWSMSDQDWQALFAHHDTFSTEDMMSITDSFLAALQAGKTGLQNLQQVLPTIVNHSAYRVALAPAGTLEFLLKHIAATPAQARQLSHYYQKLYAHRLHATAFTAKTGDSIETIEFRRYLVHFLAHFGKDAAIRKKLSQMAIAYTGYSGDGKIHPELADSSLLNAALVVAAEDQPAAFTQHLLKLFEASNDSALREKLLAAIAATHDKALAAAMREWIVSEKLRNNEIFIIIEQQTRNESVFREAMWEWFKLNFDKIKVRASAYAQGGLINVGTMFCTPERRQEVETFFLPQAESLSGGPRALAQTLETIDLCIALKAFHEPSLAAFLKE